MATDIKMGDRECTSCGEEMFEDGKDNASGVGKESSIFFGEL